MYPNNSHQLWCDRQFFKQLNPSEVVVRQDAQKIVQQNMEQEKQWGALVKTGNCQIRTGYRRKTIGP